MECRIDNSQAFHFGTAYAGARIEKIQQNPISDWQKRAVAKVCGIFKEKKNRSLYLYSNTNRNGKTYLQAAIYAEFYRSEKKQKIFSDIELEKFLSAQYFENEWGNVIQTIRNTDVFHFTDFGKIAESKDFSMPLLFDFFDKVTANNKIMIFCSNYKPADIAKFANKNWTSIAARIHEKVAYI